MDLGISGRTALVNGGSAGMGRGAALALAREGANVFVSSRGEERLVATCEAIARETGAAVTPIVADHSSDAGRQTILAACPSPDIFVATCAPPPFTNDFRDASREQMQEAFNTAFLTDADGEIVGTYDKTYLLMFGEYQKLSSTAMIRNIKY